MPGIRLWDVATSKEKPALDTDQIKKKQRSNTLWLFTPDGKYIVTSNIGQIIFWELATGALRLELATGLSNPWQLALSADGNVLLTAEGGTALVWDVRELLKGNQS